MKTLRLFPVLLLLSLLPASCSSDDSTTEDTSGTDTSQVIPADNTEETDDYTLDTASGNLITLNGTSITTTSDNVTISGTKATITAAGTYTVTGSLTDGSLVVAATATDKVKIILSGASITNSAGPALTISNAYKAIVYLAPETSNALSDASGNPDEAALYSLSGLSFFGTGSLTVTGAADAGIDSAGGIIFKDGAYNITSEGSAIKTDHNLIVDGGSYAITAGNDGLHSDTTLTINDGDINITQSEEGIEGAVITMNGGTVHLVSADDGLNGAGDDDSVAKFFYMNDGYLYINAAGDGIDVNGSIVMEGGTVIVNGPTANDNAAIDYDGTFTISGGFLVAAGSSGMAQATSAASAQNTAKLTFGSTLSANTLVHVQNSSGENVLTFAPVKAYKSVVLSTAALVTGETYTVYTSGNATGTITDGLYSNSTYSSGNLKGTFTVSSAVTGFTAN